MLHPIHIEQLWFRDFRGLRKVRLTLPDDPVTVFVGANGAGKSSVLEGTAILLSRLAARIRSPQSGGRQIGDEDIHNEASDTEIGIRLRLGNEVADWTVVKTKRGREVRERSELDQLKTLAEPIRKHLRYEPEATSIPLFAFYPVTRAVLDIPLKTKRKQEFDQLSALDNALTGAQGAFRVFFEWFRIREDYENERRVKDPAYRDPELEAVRHAVERLMPGFRNLHVRRKKLRMVVTKEGHELAVNQLSDGEKCLLALVGDLARRLALANPGAPDPLDGAGIVLIDEVELHLHPRWQHQVVGQLARTFPGCQFLITTHSPAVLSHVENGAAFLLRNEHGDVKVYALDPYGRDANDLLEDVFGTLPRAGEVENDIQRLFRLIDDEKYDEARALLQSLKERVDPNDPAFTRAQVMLWTPSGTQ